MTKFYSSYKYVAIMTQSDTAPPPKNCHEISKEEYLRVCEKYNFIPLDENRDPVV